MRADKYQLIEQCKKTFVTNHIDFKELSDTHIRVLSFDYDFWPTTQLFINMKTQKRGYGLKNLMNLFALEVERRNKESDFEAKLRYEINEAVKDFWILWPRNYRFILQERLVAKMKSYSL